MRWLIRVGLTIICALGVSPLFPPARWLVLDDGFLHLFRVTELDWMIRSGLVYPRWSSNFAYGYGYPIFNFYPPWGYYITQALHIAGLAIPSALQVTLALSVVIAALGAYALGRALFDSPYAGLLVSAAYVFFPYFVLSVYLRGAMAEVLAAAILPWLLWSLQRVIQQHKWDSIIPAAFIFAAFLLAHNLTVLLSTPLLIAYVIWQLGHTSDRWYALGRVSSVVIVGTALAAFYWLPMVSELSFVAISRSSQALTAMLDASFLTPAQLLQFTFPYQYTDQPYSLALVSLLPAMVALLVARRHSVIWLFSMLALCSIILLLDLTRVWWHAIPLLKTVQFAWRVSMLIGLSVAILTGALIAYIRHNTWRILVMILLSTILAWNALGNLTLRRLDYPEGDLTLGQMARFEINTRAVGFGSFFEYLPLTVQSLATKLDVPAFVPSPDVALESLDTQAIHLRVSTSHQVTLVWRTFYFPGWYATLDGGPLDLFPSTPLGLITFIVPPGVHHIAIGFGATLPRQIGLVISIVTLIILLGATLIVAYRRKPNVCALVILNTCIFGLVLLPLSTALTASKTPVQSTSIEVTPELRLIGLQIKNATLASTTWRVTTSQDTLSFQVVWFVRNRIDDQPFTWQLVGSDGRVWAQRTQLTRFGTGFPKAWVANEIVHDHFELPIGTEIPPAVYELQVGWGVTPPLVPVALVELLQPVRTLPEPSMMYRYNARIGNSIRLLGANVPKHAKIGGALPVTLFWRAEQDILEDFTVFVHLLDQQENLVAQHDGMPQAGFFPTMLWHPRRIIADTHTLNIPRDAPPGIYQLKAGLYRFQTLARLPVNETDDSVTISEIKIPLLPPVKPRVVLNASLGQVIRLEGFDALLRVHKNQPYTLTLYWQAITVPPKDFHVFVHILDTNDQIIAQQDAPPRRGTYPTRHWDAGERVDDAYSFVLTKMGAGRIVVGMYDPLTGERLPIWDVHGNELPERQMVITVFEVIGD